MGPGVPRRAVLECFYGPLWAAAERRQVIDFAADHGATDYVYGPAADSRTGADWRLAYGADECDLDELLRDARRRGLKAWWRVSPAAPLDRARAIDLASTQECATLLARASEIIERGFDGILLAFDDIDVRDAAASADRYPESAHPVAAAHARLANTLAAELGLRGGRLLVCPTDYWGSDVTCYRTVFGRELDPDITVCWTGESVTSRTVTADQVRQVEQQYRHPIFLWDNYPVNDWGSDALSVVGTADALRPRRLPLAPLTGREPAVMSSVAGYGCNAALAPLTGLPGIGTALRWAAEPDTYIASEAQAAVFAECARRYPGITPAVLATLADACGSLPVRSPASELATAIHAVLAVPDEATIATARRLLIRLLEMAGTIGGQWRSDLGPWLSAIDTEATAAGCALTIMANPDDPRLVRENLARIREAMPRPPVAPALLVSGALRVLIDHAEGLAGAGTPSSADGSIRHRRSQLREERFV